MGSVAAGRSTTARGAARLFQSVYQRAPSTLGSLPLMPEWYLLVAILAIASFYEFWRRPVELSVPPFDAPVSVVLLAIALGVLVVRVFGSASRCFSGGAGRLATLSRRLVAAFLWFVQPLARLWGRMHYGLTPWRRPALSRFAAPWPRTGTVWSETWVSQTDRLQALEREFRLASIGVTRGPADERWDLQVRAGALGWVRLRLAVEEHGGGKQLIRYRVWPRWSAAGLVVGAALAGLTALMAIGHRPVELGVFTVLAAVLVLRMIVDLGATTGAVLFALERHEEPQPSDLVDELKEQLPGHAPHTDLKRVLAPARKTE